MKAAKKNRFQYLRSDKEPDGKKKSGPSVRVKKFSEMQDVGEFYDYLYSLPNVKDAVAKNTLGSEISLMDHRSYEEMMNPATRDLPATYTTFKRPTIDELEFQADDLSVGPPTEKMIVLEDRNPGSPSDIANKNLRHEQMGLDYLIREANPEYPLGLNAEDFYKIVKEDGVIGELKSMYPNAPKELFDSAEGLAELVSRRARDKFSYSQNFDTFDDPYRNGAVVPTNSSGSKGSPFIMGMASVQKRGRDNVFLNTDSPRSTAVHEMAHAGDFQTDTSARYIRERIAPGAESTDPYLYNPSEIRSRLMEIREQLYRKGLRDPKDKYREEDLSKVDQGLLGLERLREIFNDDGITDLLNNIY